MIQPQDLRIGNLVFSRDKIICEVICIEKDGRFTEFKAEPLESGKATWELPYEPIELTEQWLKDFGFEYRSGNVGMSVADKWQGMDYWYKNIPNNIDLTLRGTPGKRLLFYSYYGTKIKYVHQIQNLYYVLTGNEFKHERL